MWFHHIVQIMYSIFLHDNANAHTLRCKVCKLSACNTRELYDLLASQRTILMHLCSSLLADAVKWGWPVSMKADSSLSKAFTDSLKEDGCKEISSSTQTKYLLSADAACLPKREVRCVFTLWNTQKRVLLHCDWCHGSATDIMVNLT